jgi:hypothetical protein
MPHNKLVVTKYLMQNFVNSLSGKIAGLDIKTSGNFLLKWLLEVTRW